MNEPTQTENNSSKLDNDMKSNQEASKKSYDGKKSWAIVEFESDTEDDLEGFIDLVPTLWISSTNALCWYPMHQHKATIEKLAKKCVAVDTKWKCFSMKMIQEGIEDYNKGMKMLVKVSKNPNLNIHSDLDEKGKGKRMKKPNKRFDDFANIADVTTDADCTLEKKQKNTNILLTYPKLIPSIPELDFNQNKENQRPKRSNSVLPKHDKLKMINLKETDVVKQLSLSKETYFLSHVSNNDKVRQLQCIESRPDSLNRPMEIITHLSHTADHRNRNAPYSNHQGSKMPSKMMHKCAYGSDGKITLESLADAVCFFNNELSSCKITLKKMDRTIDSFMS
ncbi:uncharacterized protein [Linepithema humile]|uniref:uncharacterized protein n=1 Tax=Linepithema humile TaxID=83485 RepID=UPI00351F297E